MHVLNEKKKVVTDPNVLLAIVKALKAQDCKIVVTIGTWDMLHVSHVRYLKKAKEQGDILIVGTDSDRAVKVYKNPLRPMIPEVERMEMLSYQSCVDLIVLVDDVDSDGKWQYELIKAVQPDVFVAVEDSYPPEQIEEIRKHCTNVEILSRQGETSTSNLIHKIMKEVLGPMFSAMKKYELDKLFFTEEEKVEKKRGAV